jgi:hypothetical protein
MPETQERPPPILKTSMVGSLGGDAGDLGVPTTYLEDVDGGPLEVMLETRERPPPILKTSMAGSLGGPTTIHGPKVCCDMHRQHR